MTDQQLPSPEARSAMHQLVESNRRRLKVRRWIGIGAIPVVLIALVVVIKILSVYGLAYRAASTYAAGAFDQTVAAARWQGFANVIEPYKAHYNFGTGQLRLGKLGAARESLERAVKLAPDEEACAPRFNLASAIEAQGDEATRDGDAEAGQKLYQEALGVLSLAPEGCRDKRADAHSPDPSRSMPDSLDELEKRILSKLRQESGESSSDDQDDEQNDEQQQDPPPDGSQEDDQDQPDDSQLDDLEQKLREGEQDRSDRERGGESGGGGTERPW